MITKEITELPKHQNICLHDRVQKRCDIYKTEKFVTKLIHAQYRTRSPTKYTHTYIFCSNCKMNISEFQEYKHVIFKAYTRTPQSPSLNPQITLITPITGLITRRLP